MQDEEELKPWQKLIGALFIISGVLGAADTALKVKIVDLWVFGIGIWAVYGLIKVLQLGFFEIGKKVDEFQKEVDADDD
jgi:hypothetical protein